MARGFFMLLCKHHKAASVRSCAELRERAVLFTMLPESRPHRKMCSNGWKHFTADLNARPRSFDTLLRLLDAGRSTLAITTLFYSSGASIYIRERIFFSEPSLRLRRIG